MAIIDRVKWEGTENVFAWRYPSDQLSTWTQLIVMESQEAFLAKEGRFEGPFGAGRHVLDTKNIPILVELLSLPFGQKTPFTAEVWFVNKMMNLDVKWGTPNPIQIQDPKYKVMIPVRAFGQFGVQVGHSKKFLTKLVGTLRDFSKNKLREYLRGIIITAAKDTIAEELVSHQTSVLEVAAKLEEISESLAVNIRRKIETFGLNLINFQVNSINVPEEDPAVSRLKEALAKKAEMDIMGYSYQEKRSFDTMEKAASNQGSSPSNFMGAGMGMGMGMTMGGAMGGAMGQMSTNLQFNSNLKCPECGLQNQPNARFCFGCGYSFHESAEPKASPPEKVAPKITCNKCGAELSPKSKFCPACGDPVHPCPHCGADNDPQAATCATCGKPLPLPCLKCGELLAQASKFCPHCGASQILSCANCGHELKPMAKFCPECGTKI
ncbi:SPFH domain-containing protein [Dethiosulfatarculus sandiegensis]|uniref:Antifreeze protein type I n=1 Tax=Dethiosulfatarculus sandiegensis TaxID=1429043 RepID=A0A0D2HZF1_9BACT|nr:SPFH domain-containing protein [Dethiosulfatarculus sandiegensis]KIX15643.1 antifreeze protein type I [Dethiosulfatarculus sandiegensis]